MDAPGAAVVSSLMKANNVRNEDAFLLKKETERVTAGVIHRAKL